MTVTSRSDEDVIVVNNEAEGTASQSSMLVAEYADLRDRVRVVDSDVADGHIRALLYDLEIRTRSRAKESPTDLLNNLADRGFSWTGIARLAGVSTSAIRKWRNAEEISGQNRLALSRLVAFVDMLEESFGVVDVASWMEMPLADPYEVSAIDVYADFERGWEILSHLAMWPTDAAALLDQQDPGWREEYGPSRYRVTHDEDGRPTISRSPDG